MENPTNLAARIESLELEVQERRKDAHRHAAAVRLLRDLLSRVGAEDNERICAVLEDLEIKVGSDGVDPACSPGNASVPIQPLHPSPA